MRPTRLAEVVGQEHLLGPGRVIREALAADQLPSMILWGPPGSGKTTLAKIFALESRAVLESVSAVVSGVPELRKLVAQARERKAMQGRATLLFVDEIHRFNKAQQDVLLPHVERGSVTLVGATTENPSFAINAALLSRATVFRLDPLTPEQLVEAMKRALDHPERGYAGRVPARDEVLHAIAQAAQGDCRRALGVLETCVRHSRGQAVELATVEEVLKERPLLYDRAGEEHYNVVSAFIKSLRGSDPDAALYWMMRMVEAGEDPLFIMRRLLIFASEDIGNADPRALELAVSADAAFRRLGLPEGLLAMAQCCTYLASAPKSNASYAAMKAARDDVRRHGALAVPMKLRNAPTRAMKQWGYGDGYRYPHDEGGYATGETYLPERLLGRRYYEPTDQGFEVRIAARLRSLRGEGTASSRPEGSSVPVGSGASVSHTSTMSQTQTIRGTIRRLGLEGGLWSLVTADGQSFELLDPDDALRRDGLTVEIEAKRQAADVTVGMIGEAVEVRTFRIVEP